jgi:hypothetical protein
MAKKVVQLSLEQGLKYPWGKAKRLLNIFWILIPIIGYFAIIGYTKKIIHAVYKGDFTGLPEFGKFSVNMGEGFWIFLKMLPLTIIYVAIGFIPVVGQLLSWLVALLVIPFMFVHLVIRGDFAATFDFKTWKIAVIDNFSSYIITVIYGFVYTIVYLFLSLILVGIPALVFGSSIFYVDFYKKFVK